MYNVANPASAKLSGYTTSLFWSGSVASDSWTPINAIADWSSDGTYITIPIASFRLLTASEADGTTGDLRAVINAFCDSFFVWYNDLETKPEALSADLRSYSIQRTGDFQGNEKVTYSFTMYRNHPENTIVAEPD